MDLNFSYRILAFTFLIFVVNGLMPDIKIVKDWSKYDKFGQISAVSVDSKGNVFILHRGERVWNSQSFLPDNTFAEINQGPIKNNTLIVLNSTTGEVMKEAGSKIFYLPHGLTIDHDDNIWITDVAMHQVFKFPPLNLTSKTSDLNNIIITLGKEFMHGKTDESFCKPTDVAIVKATGDFFVSDGYCNSRIVKFDRSGRKIVEWGRRAAEKITPQTLNVPHALTLDEERNILYVADREDLRIVAYDFNGKFIQEYSNTDVKIFSVAYSPMNGGLLFSVGSSISTMKGVGLIYQVNGSLLGSFNSPTSFMSPHDVALSKDGTACFVVELSPHVAWKFELDLPKSVIKPKEEVIENFENLQIGGTSLAISLVISTIVISLLIFMYHIYKKKGGYRRSEMRGLILDEEEDSLNVN